MLLYAVVFFPKFNLKKIQEFRKKYDPQYNILPPHITLMYPFSGVSKNQVVQHLDTITREAKPLQIHLQNLTKSFDNHLFLLVNEGKEEINQLHNRLYSDIMVSYLRNNIPFVPHITLGKFNTANNQLDTALYDKAYEETHSLNLDTWCNFDSVSLIQGNGKSPAKTIQAFTLKH